MNTHGTREIPASRRRLTMMMIVCGAAGAALAGNALAGTALACTARAGAPSTAAGQDAPSIAVRYSPQSLDTESGARMLYNRLVQAAGEVCPQSSASPHWLSEQVRECREHAVAQAVLQVNNPWLASVYATSTRCG
jgi:UrcA family protein